MPFFLPNVLIVFTPERVKREILNCNICHIAPPPPLCSFTVTRSHSQHTMAY